MIELEHSPLGGSSANRFINCGGSFLLHRALLLSGELEEVPSEYADLGTSAHELGAVCLSEERETYEFIGEKFGRFSVGFASGEINPNALGVYVNEARDIIDKAGKGQLLIETTIKKPEAHRLLKGTIDFGYWTQKGLWLRDYKNGEGVPVSAFRNRQLLYYAFLMVLDYPWLTGQPDSFPMNLGIVQPNIYGMEDAVDIWETDLGTVKAFGYEELLPAMKRLDRPQDIHEEDFVAGDHCQFCPVMLDCPRLQKAFRTYAEGTEFVDMLTNEELDSYYAEKPHAKKFMNELDKVMFARLMAKKPLTQAKLVAKRVNRAWKPGAKKAVTERFGSKAFNPPEFKSPAQIEKMSSDGKALALEFGYTPDTVGFSVAPISDKRPAAAPPSNAEVFASYAVSSPEEAGF